MNTESEQAGAEPTSVITVRVPMSLHADLKEFLFDLNLDRKPVERWSMNAFCVEAIRAAMKSKPESPPRTLQEIVDDANMLALLFYRAHGYVAEPGFRFDQSSHPQERGMFNLAIMAYQEIEGTDIQEALEEIGEGKE